MASARLVSLDERLSAVASLFPVCGRGADIGADHGKLSARLLQENKCDSMLLSDISAVSLEKAKRLFETLNLTDRAAFKVADGFDALTEPTDCVAVCGMGSRTICSMIRRRPELPGHPILLLSAHTEVPRLRRTLSENGYDIEKELLVRSNGRFYIVLKAVWHISNMTEKEISIGKNLSSADNDMVLRYYRWQLMLEEKKQMKDVQRIQWLKEALSDA